jgi:hypothetical protein
MLLALEMLLVHAGGVVTMGAVATANTGKGLAAFQVCGCGCLCTVCMLCVCLRAYVGKGGMCMYVHAVNNCSATWKVKQ